MPRAPADGREQCTSMGGTVIVETRCGRLRGGIQRSFEGYDFCAFKGIPYAKPPVGQLRFKDPIPVEPWSGLKEATEYGPMCLQCDYIDPESVLGSEDCLYLNVYVKEIKPNSSLPVMVWIHGGAFLYGSADDLFYGPDYLLRQDIVLVTINYRLGVLGFLDFDDEVAPGNQGLKDQVMALRWVQQNIENFGGNPNNVTIFGESAGGASVNYLTLSPLAKGLFHKAISQSGAACNPWACCSDKKYAYRICELFGKKSKNPNELVEFLRTVDCEDLIRAQSKAKFPEDKLRGTFAFAPGVDRKSKEPFMPIHPLEAIKEGVHIPYMLGNNSREGILFLRGMEDEHYDMLDKNFVKYLNPITARMLEKHKTSPNDLRRYYFGNESITEKNSEKFVDFNSDIHFIQGVHKVVEAQVKRSSAPTYYYLFSYDKEFSVTKNVANSSLSGASHFDEVQYIFSMRAYDMFSVDRPKRGTTAYRIIEQITEMWANFAKNGIPTPAVNDLISTYWLPVTDPKAFRTLNINEELRMGITLNVGELLSFGKYMTNKL